MALFADLIQRDTRANQPAATAVADGTLYFVTDETVLERSNGTTWQAYSEAAGGGLWEADGDAAKFIGQYFSPEFDAGTSGSSKTIDWDDGNTQLLQLTDNVGTLTLSNPQSGGRYLLALEQGGSGSYTVTWPSDVKWAGGVAPTLTTTVGRVDVITLVYIEGIGGSPAGRYLAAANLDYTP